MNRLNFEHRREGELTSFATPTAWTKESLRALELLLQFAAHWVSSHFSFTLLTSVFGRQGSLSLLPVEQS